MDIRITGGQDCKKVIQIRDLVLSGFVAVTLFEKTKPIYSDCVMRDAHCEKEFGKTKPILEPQMDVSSYHKGDYENT